MVAMGTLTPSATSLAALSIAAGIFPSHRACPMKKPVTVMGVKSTANGSRIIGEPLIVAYTTRGAAGLQGPNAKHSGCRTADAIERQADGAPPTPPPSRRSAGVYLRTVDDDHVAAGGLQLGHELGAPHDVHGPQTTRLREGNHPAPHARVGRILYDEVTAIQIDVVAQQERRWSVD